MDLSRQRTYTTGVRTKTPNYCTSADFPPYKALRTQREIDLNRESPVPPQSGRDPIPATDVSQAPRLLDRYSRLRAIWTVSWSAQAVGGRGVGISGTKSPVRQPHAQQPT